MSPSGMPFGEGCGSDIVNWDVARRRCRLIGGNKLTNKSNDASLAKEFTMASHLVALRILLYTYIWL